MTVPGGDRRIRSGRRAGVLIASALLAGVGVTGCSVDLDSDDEAGAGCPEDRPLNSPSLVLIAQAVPSASLVPCIVTVPRGWQEKLTVVNERAEYAFTDRGGDRALTVILSRTCDLRGASRVPSEATGSRRYELPTRVTDGYGGSRFYVFPGGCITYRFDLHGSTRAQAVTEATSAVGFTTRDTVREMVARHSDGRLHLDVAAGGQS